MLSPLGFGLLAMGCSAMFGLHDLRVEAPTLAGLRPAPTTDAPEKVGPGRPAVGRSGTIAARFDGEAAPVQVGDCLQTCEGPEMIAQR